MYVQYVYMYLYVCTNCTRHIRTYICTCTHANVASENQERADGWAMIIFKFVLRYGFLGYKFTFIYICKYYNLS